MTSVVVRLKVNVKPEASLESCSSESDEIVRYEQNEYYVEIENNKYTTCDGNNNAVDNSIYIQNKWTYYIRKLDGSQV